MFTELVDMINVLNCMFVNVIGAHLTVSYLLLFSICTGPTARFTSEIVKRWLGAGALDR